MVRLSLPASWLPHSLRWQFLLAVSALTLLILAGGITAVYALRTSAMTIRQLAEERLVQMQEAQDLVQRTLLIERKTYQLSNAESLTEMRQSYEEIVYLLAEFDALVERLVANVGGDVLLDLHQSSQMFRNTVNVAAQLREMKLKGAGKNTDGHLFTDSPRQHYLRELHKQAESLMNTAQLQSRRITQHYREAVQALDAQTQRNMQWVTLLLAASLAMAWIVAQWFLGWHVLGRLQQVSRDLRLGDDSGYRKKLLPIRDPGALHQDEIDEMAHAVELFQEDRRQLGQRTQELLQARDVAESANKAKSVFLANMSHELRTPLNAILGFSSLMCNAPGIPESQRESLEIINHSGEHLLKLVNDVLEMAKIEAGHLQLQTAVFDFATMVLDVVGMMRLRASEKGLSLLLDQASDFPRFIKGDEARLRQILLNLVSNAVKYTQEGEVAVRLRTRDNTQRRIVIEVVDTGPGIDPDNYSRLFQPFVQLTLLEENGQQMGTGLGLTITREFVHLMGGEISLESTIGKGSLFRVELPLEPADANEVERQREQVRRKVVGLVPGQPTYRILIAEDQRENLLLLEHLMANIGVSTKHAENGKECIEIFKDWHPDLIWMDRRMPVMDGLEATRRIRGLEGGHSVKIVAVTASAFMEQRQEMEDAGMDDMVRKPYRAEEIYDCMAQQLDLKFLYTDDIESAAYSSEKISSTEIASMLSKLPAGLLRDLRQSLESLETSRIDTLIGQVHETDPALATILRKLASKFDYPRILDALDRICTDE